MSELDCPIQVRHLLQHLLFHVPKTDYEYCTADPAVGIIYIINNFISGHVRLRGRPNGAYPYKYLEMIDSLFGHEDNTIEVCSGEVTDAKYTVDVDELKPAFACGDGKRLYWIRNCTFKRWRCDPPYNEKTARQMYDCNMPSYQSLLAEGARVVKKGSLLFFLCAQNYQVSPKKLKRIGLITMSIVPNNELRALNIYVKL